MRGIQREIDVTESKRFARLEALFHDLVDLDPSEQSRRLRALEDSDPDIVQELKGMLDETLAAQREQLDGLMDLAGQLNESGASVPEDIGPYRIIRLLGQGGMGQVYEAEQSEPVKRRVALKLARGELLSEAARVRFLAERQNLALLDHPNIAKIFDAGSTAGGQLWFVMELVHGQPITRWSVEKKLTAHQCIELILPICDAVQHAHQKGVIHRDIKPSNLLVIDDGAIGQPRVIDFGVAKTIAATDEEPDYATRIGEALGTPQYMSPEQASLGEVDVDTRSDVYALGLVLHEMLVGRLPIASDTLRTASFGEICRRVREEAPGLPSRLQPGRGAAAKPSQLTGDLDLVLMKALAKDREQRYESAAAFAEDLQRFLIDQPVRAAAPGLMYRARKFVRRNRALVAAAAVVVAALLVATVVSGLGLVEARKAEQRALAAAQEADRARDEAEQSLARAQFFLGRANLYNLAQNAYSDALQRMFGNEADVERQTEVLLSRWREAVARQDEEPEGAALMSYAVGRHFLFRNDYPTALEVLEPWVRAGYGPPDLLSLGKTLMPVLYINLGRPEEAVPLLRENVAAFAKGWEANTPDHVAAATQLASITAQDEDLRHAESVLAQAMEVDHGPQVNMYFFNQLALMKRLRGDLDGAHQALRDLVGIIDSFQLMDISGTDTGRLNLAAFEVYHSRDLARAETLIDEVLENSTAARGENRESGRARVLLGVIRAHQGQYDEALELLAAGVGVTRRFGGERSQPLAFAKAAWAEVLASSGNFDRAQEVMEEGWAAVPAQDARGLVKARMELAASWLRAKQGFFDEAAYSALVDAFDQRLLQTDPVLMARYRALTALP